MVSNKPKRTPSEQVLHDLSNMTLFWMGAAAMGTVLAVVACGYVVVRVLPFVGAYLQAR